MESDPYGAEVSKSEVRFDQVLTDKFHAVSTGLAPFIQTAKEANIK
jgi:hypothetical protein